MKKTIYLFLICCISISKMEAQYPPDSMLVSAYNQALQRYQEKYGIYHPPGKQKVYSDYLKPESLSEGNREHYMVVTEHSLYPKCNRLRIPRKIELAYQINHINFQSSTDTIDIIVSERRFKCLKRKLLGVSVACRGDMGYIPDGRLILDKNKKWVIISHHTLYAEALERSRAKQ